MPRNHLDTIFVDRVIDLLENNPNGLTKDDFLNQYYTGILPNPSTCEQCWNNFKRVELYSNVMFNARQDEFVWIRARRGPRNTFYYHAVAKVENGNHRILLPEFFGHQLKEQHTSELKTRIKTQMRSVVAEAEQMKARGITSGNTNVVEEAERKLSEITVISARLASINFGDGIVLDELRRLEAAPSLSLLHPQIKRALDAVERAGKSIDELANTVLRLKAIAQPNVRREIEG